MSVQYRCRCGQEVILRPREGVYVTAAVLIGLTLLNTIFVLLLWSRLGDLQEPSPSAVGDTESRGVAKAPTDDPPPQNPGSRPHGDVGDPVDPEDSSRRTARSETAGRSGEQDSRHKIDGDHPTSPHNFPPKIPTSIGAEVGPLIGAVTDGALAPSEAVVAPPPGDPPPSLALKVAAEENSEFAAAAVVASDNSGVDWPLECPPDLDGLAIRALLDELPPVQDPGRHLALLGSVMWGSADLRQRAAELLRAENRSWHELAMLPRDADLGEDPLLAATAGEVHQAWSNWDRILTRTRSPWIQSCRARRPRGTDTVFLIDLSESMSQEADRVAAALIQMLPLLDSRESHRFGWVGFRDEVVDQQPLSSDVDSFLASLRRWECRSGGDVPEGVDRALFEALRFGAFDWQQDVDRRFVLIGDAPPPYERVRGMISMAEGAHLSEGYQIHALGLLRELELYDSIPCFADLSRVTRGKAWFLEEGKGLEEVVWQLLLGPEAPAWRRRSV